MRAEAGVKQTAV